MINNNRLNNISAEEINKFNRFSQDWWDPNGSMKSLHDINPMRVNYISQIVSLEGKEILDVGCGGGILTESLIELGAQMTGIDGSPDMITIAKQHASSSRRAIRYFNTNIEQFAQDSKEHFDVILCMELLEHVPDYVSVVQSIKTLIKPGGQIIFATINRNILSYLLAIIAAEYVLKLLPKNTHQFQSFITTTELNHACQINRLKLTDTRGFSYNPFTKTYYLCRNTWVNYFASYIA